MMQQIKCAQCDATFQHNDTQYACSLYRHTDWLCKSCYHEVELFIEENGNNDIDKRFSHCANG